MCFFKNSQELPESEATEGTQPGPLKTLSVFTRCGKCGRNGRPWCNCKQFASYKNILVTDTQISPQHKHWWGLLFCAAVPTWTRVEQIQQMCACVCVCVETNLFKFLSQAQWAMRLQLHASFRESSAFQKHSVSKLMKYLYSLYFLNMTLWLIQEVSGFDRSGYVILTVLTGTVQDDGINILIRLDAIRIRFVTQSKRVCLC